VKHQLKATLLTATLPLMITPLTVVMLPMVKPKALRNPLLKKENKKYSITQLMPE